MPLLKLKLSAICIGQGVVNLVSQGWYPDDIAAGESLNDD